jgi:polyhydroxyalkanoate synthase
MNAFHCRYPVGARAGLAYSSVILETNESARNIMQTTNWNTLGAFGVQTLKNMDRSRQARGSMLDRAGYGPRQAPSTILHAEAGLNVRRYDGGNPDGPPVLIVPAPIKRAYIWDLAPETSVVRRWIERGYRVYIAEWVPVPDSHGHFGLDDYGDRLLSTCRAAMAADGAGAPAIVAGHSLGGILAAIHSALYPDRVAATIVLESPLHVEAQSCCFSPLVKATPDARQIADTFRQVPGVFLNMMSALAEPHAFQWERFVDRCLSMTDPQALATHMRVERWTHDEFPLPGELFTQIVESLYRHDEFMQGRLTVGGRQVGPANLRAPLVSVVDPRSRLIPPEAMVPFHEAASSERKLLLHYEGDIGVNLQHVGVLVGRNAHAKLWPAIFDWLKAPAAAASRSAS